MHIFLAVKEHSRDARRGKWIPVDLSKLERRKFSKRFRVQNMVTIFPIYNTYNITHSHLILIPKCSVCINERTIGHDGMIV